MTELSDIIFNNWTKWADGGIDEESISHSIKKKDMDILIQWIDTGYVQFNIKKPVINIKYALDIITWCLYGTHTLLLLPPEIRENNIVNVSNQLDVPLEVLLWCINETDLVKKYL